MKINNLKKLFQKWGVPPLISVFIYISSYFLLYYILFFYKKVFWNISNI